MSSIRFDDRVAIVTGAGGGLGRAYALALAARGAKVVVNDRGGARDGTGQSDAAAKVVAEIEAAGGQAIADGGDVTNPADMAAMVDRAMGQWGRIDILINNAGILRDKSFVNMSDADFEMVVKVHLVGSGIATKAVWPAMRAAAYGRVLMTSSSTGLYGNFGQANYGAAKLGLVGLMKTLALEGAKYNIHVNSVSPVAATRMTEDLFPPAMLERFVPDAVVPAALFLVSDQAPTGQILGAGGGGVNAAHVTMTRGVALETLEPESVAAAWDRIVDRDGATVPQAGSEQTAGILARLAEAGQV